MSKSVENNNQIEELNDKLTEFERNIYYTVRDYFDYAIYLVEEITGLMVDERYAQQILQEYIARQGYMYYDATYHNIPWMLLYFCGSEPVYGKLVHDGSLLYNMLNEREDVSLTRYNDSQYYKVDKAGVCQDLRYSVILHEKKVENNEVREEIHFRLLSLDEDNLPVWKADKVLKINEYRFSNLIHSKMAMSDRKDELLQIARQLMPDLP